MYLDRSSVEASSERHIEDRSSSGDAVSGIRRTSVSEDKGRGRNEHFGSGLALRAVTSANSGAISALGRFSKARQRQRPFDRKANARISRVYRVRVRAITKLPIDIVQIRFIFFGRRFEKGRYL